MLRSAPVCHWGDRYVSEESRAAGIDRLPDLRAGQVLAVHSAARGVAPGAGFRSGQRAGSGMQPGDVVYPVGGERGDVVRGAGNGERRRVGKYCSRGVAGLRKVIAGSGIRRKK